MPVLESITVTPDPAACTDEGQVQLTAIGHYDDASTADITADCSWQTADELDVSVVVMGSSLSQPGLVLGVAPGTATVLAVFPPYWIGGIDFVQGTVEVTVTAAEPPVDPEGRVLLAFGGSTLDPDPDWTRLDDTPNLVTSYTIDRGRQFELDRTDAGRATVQIADPDGILDPTNPAGPYYGQLQPLLQAAIGRYDPVAEQWKLRYRGFVDDFAYVIDPSQRVSRLTLSLVDLFEILTAAEMHPLEFGAPPPEESQGQVYYPPQTFHDRIVSILGDLGLSKRFWVVLPGHVKTKSTVYSPGETALAAIQEAADAEFPAIANSYCDRRGRFVCHDHDSRFHPAETASALGPEKWDYHEWKAGDGVAVALSPTDTVQVRELAFSRSLSQIVNSASATPVGIIDSDVPGALYFDSASIGQYGIRSWSADNLINDGDMAGATGDLFECKQFAIHRVTNYAQPRDRITTIGFRPLDPSDPRAAALWEFLNTVDISDSVEVTVAAPGGGGFTSEAYFVEGIHEQVGPLTPGYDDVSLHLDLAPRSYYAYDPFP